MSFFGKLFGRRKGPEIDEGEPFMEHPTGEFNTALQAITSAMKRLHRADIGDRWITFSGQGQGHRADSCYVVDVPFNGRTFDLHGQTIDLGSVMEFAGLDTRRVVVQTDAEGKITLSKATPEELARFLDAVFRKHFGVKPFEGEDDYAVGAEWQP